MKAKIGRQYVLQSSLSSARAFRSSPPAQARTTLQRVVENRSGECPPLAIASGITPAHRLIYAFVRQALNLQPTCPRIPSGQAVFTILLRECRDKVRGKSENFLNNRERC